VQTLAPAARPLKDLRSSPAPNCESWARIILDLDAAGHGWYIDATPYEHEEFLEGSLGLCADPDGAAATLVDCQTVIMHELGHILGLGDAEDGIMRWSLGCGVRLLPSLDEVGCVAWMPIT